MKKIYLFVGGGADGHMIEVDPRYNYWCVPVINDRVDDGNVDQYKIIFNEEVYRKIEWQSGGGDDFVFFASTNLSNREVMRMILDNYKPKHDVELDNRVKSMKMLLERCVDMFEISYQWVVDSKQRQKIWDFTFELLKFLNKN